MRNINRRLLISLSFIICHLSFSPLGAQTFTQRIQQQKAGQGTVTIHESTEIDQLVNESKLGPVASPTSTTKPATTKPTTTKPSNATTNDPSKASSQSAQEETSEEGAAEPTKKIMTGGYKINGYRVQAFAGGNSRKDRQQAESVGNQIKSSYPGVPVYVHFYSPRWICRVGNYRTYEEAHQMLLSLRKMGFSEAVVVKGKITVYD
jgi:hypothetical protein